MKSTAESLYLFSSCLQWVRRATRLASNSCCTRRHLTHLSWRSWLMNYSVHCQSVNASFMWDLTNRSVRFWIIFLIEDKVFDILSVLVDTNRTRSAAAFLPINVLSIFFNRMSILSLPHFEHLLWACLTGKICRFLCSMISQNRAVALDKWSGKWNHLLMTHRVHRLTLPKNYCNRTLTVKVIA